MQIKKWNLRVSPVILVGCVVSARKNSRFLLSVSDCSFALNDFWTVDIYSNDPLYKV
jgi:hypothetical protein